jgi:ubiquinone biosynthesis monooxygenase Coq7
MRHISTLDRFIQAADQCIRTLHGIPVGTQRSNPAEVICQEPLASHESKLSGRLMRINHTGEVCAQALYQGQALTARTPEIRETMKQAALEENDHLLWCKSRLDDLNSHTSYLNSLWWLGSFCIGVTAGLMGDKWSLGFLEETEDQVGLHLQQHLEKLPIDDHASRAIISQMVWDESQHATLASEQGAAQLPEPVRHIMRFASKIMTGTTYYL